MNRRTTPGSSSASIRAMGRAGSLLALASVLFCLAPVARAPAQSASTTTIQTDNVQAAQGFISQLSDRGIGLLADTSLSHDQQIAGFRQLLQQGVDIPRVARFTLGRYWRVASPEQRQDFQRLFQEWLLSNYVSRFADYSGQTITVTGAQPESDKLVVVHSLVNQTNGAPPVGVDWRVWVQNGQARVVDVVVEGVSMAITLRSQFASVIQNNGGDVSALLARMRSAVGSNSNAASNLPGPA